MGGWLKQEARFWRRNWQRKRRAEKARDLGLILFALFVAVAVKYAAHNATPPPGPAVTSTSSTTTPTARSATK